MYISGIPHDALMYVYVGNVNSSIPSTDSIIKRKSKTILRKEIPMTLAEG